MSDGDALAALFADLSDDALLERIRSGGLTDSAMRVAEKELESRGLRAVPPEKQNRSQSPQSNWQSGTQDGPDLVHLVGLLKPMEAEVLRSRLEAEGVYAIVADADLARIGWASPADGGARVLVAERDFEKAKIVLKHLQRGDYSLDDNKEPARCPHCGGTKLTTFVPSLVASLFKYGGQPGRRARCETCGKTWLNSTSSI